MTSRDNRAIGESNERQTVALYSTFSGDQRADRCRHDDNWDGWINGAATRPRQDSGALERTAAAAFKNPTYNINGMGTNDNNLFGSRVHANLH